MLFFCPASLLLTACLFSGSSALIVSQPRQPLLGNHSFLNHLDIKAEGVAYKEAKRQNATNSDDPCEVCSFDPGFKCLHDGQCFAYSTKGACEKAGGAMCVPPSSCTSNCETCMSDKKCQNCKAGFVSLAGTCIKMGATTPDRWLNAHNVFRCMHGAPPVEWNALGQVKVYQYVNSLTRMTHSDSYKLEPPAGENLAQGNDNLEAAVASWYSEISLCASDSCTGAQTGHYTAVVWKSTTKIACAQNTNAQKIYMCRYDSSAPNYAGEYIANVKKATKTFDECAAQVALMPPTDVGGVPSDGPPANPPTGGTSSVADGLGAMDTNKDGKIQKSEMDAMFDRMDTNKDGVIDSSEMAASGSQQQ